MSCQQVIGRYGVQMIDDLGTLIIAQLRSQVPEENTKHGKQRKCMDTKPGFTCKWQKWRKHVEMMACTWFLGLSPVLNRLGHELGA
jgi:hypothetical protein